MNPSRSLAVAFAALSLSPAVRAQVDVVWTKALPQHSVTDSVLGRNGATYTVGWESIASPSASVATRVDADGTVRWERTFAHGEFTVIDRVTAAPSGGIVACGWTDLDLTLARNEAVAVVRYGPEGDELWRRILDGVTSGTERAMEARATSTGEFLIGGTAAPTPFGEDLGLWKLAADGTVLWSVLADHAPGSRDKLAAIEVDAQGNTLMLGDSVGARMILVKVDPNGTVLWQRAFFEAGAGYSYARDLAVDALGNSYSLGRIRVGAYDNVVVAKHDATGNFVWQRDVTSPNAVDGAPYFISVDVLGNAIVTGNFRQVGQAGPTYDGFVAKIAADGTQLWLHTIDGSAHGNEALRGILLASDGDVYVCGNLTQSHTGGLSESLLLRYGPDGTEKWRFTYDSPHITPSNDAWFEIFEGEDGSIYAQGQTAAPGTPGQPTVARLTRASLAYCFGDGSSGACPCGNQSVAGLGSGCTNSLGVAARLSDEGIASLSVDGLVLTASGMPDSNVVFFQADGQGLAPFGDGLLCATGTTRRLATRPIVGGSATYPTFGEAPISVRGDVLAPGVRTYQALYRNAAAFCSAETFNTTNAIRVTWAP